MKHVRYSLSNLRATLASRSDGAGDLSTPDIFVSYNREGSNVGEGQLRATSGNSTNPGIHRTSIPHLTPLLPSKINQKRQINPTASAPRYTARVAVHAEGLAPIPI